jgi:hypothetical protein
MGNKPSEKVKGDESGDLNIKKDERWCINKNRGIPRES